MGWVELVPYFCAASETARDVAVDYIETKVGALPTHKFSHWARADKAPVSAQMEHGEQLRHLVEVYVDNFIACIIPTTKQHVEHVTRGILHGIHNISPPSEVDSMDPISNRKLRKCEGTFGTSKCLLGFKFDGVEKTIWLKDAKRVSLLQILRQWIRRAVRGKHGIPFVEFESVVAKLRRTFTALREGRRLLSPCNWVIQ